MENKELIEIILKAVIDDVPIPNKKLLTIANVIKKAERLEADNHQLLSELSVLRGELRGGNHC